MKFIILFVALFALACADNSPVSIERLDSSVDPEKWSFNFLTSDGTYAEQVGILQNAGTEHELISVKGSYEYVGPDGVKYTVNYIADENGYQPEGDHLPKAYVN